MRLPFAASSYIKVLTPPKMGNKSNTSIENSFSSKPGQSGHCKKPLVMRKPGKSMETGLELKRDGRRRKRDWHSTTMTPRSLSSCLSVLCYVAIPKRGGSKGEVGHADGTRRSIPWSSCPVGRGSTARAALCGALGWVLALLLLAGSSWWRSLFVQAG